MNKKNDSKKKKKKKEIPLIQLSVKAVFTQTSITQRHVHWPTSCNSPLRLSLHRTPTRFGFINSTSSGNTNSFYKHMAFITSSMANFTFIFFIIYISYIKINAVIIPLSETWRRWRHYWTKEGLSFLSLADKFTRQYADVCILKQHRLLNYMLARLT